MPHLSASYSITMRLKILHQPGMLGKVTTRIGELGGNIMAIDTVRPSKSGRSIFRDVSIMCDSEEHERKLTRVLDGLDGVTVVAVSDRTFLAHLGGKIEVKGKLPLRTRDDLSIAYTPGVARICRAIHEDVSASFNLTIRRNTVAVVSDGSAILGLGNLGPEAAMPVMEGKAQLFKEFGGVDAFPICINVHDADGIVNFVKAIAPTFGGINLEDIASPICFEVERRLVADLDIPVFHDDQHGTAIVMLAGLLNAVKVVGKDLEKCKIVFSGAGAAGIACTKILLAAGCRDVILCDRFGAIHKGRTDLNMEKKAILAETNPNDFSGSLKEALVGADIFIGLSSASLLTHDDVAKMASKAIIFAMANPDPEIFPEDISKNIAVMATGRSDYPNQINNVLAFPGIFKGALEAGARLINDEMKLAAAYAIAELVLDAERGSDYIVPSVFHPEVGPKVAEAVKAAAIRTGVCRKASLRGADLSMQTP